MFKKSLNGAGAVLLALFVCLLAASCHRVSPTGKLRQAITEAKAGNWDDAIFNTDICLRYDNENIHAMILNSYCLLAKNDSEAAVKKALYNLQKATMLDATRFDAWYIYGWGLYSQKNYADAIQALENALKLVPGNKKELRGNILAMLGNSYLKTNLLPKAMSRIQPLRIIDLYARRPELYNCLALIALKNGNASQAVAFFKDALERDPDNKAVLQNLAVTYDLYLNDVKNARTFYVKCLGAKQADGDTSDADKIRKRLAVFANRKNAR